MFYFLCNEMIMVFIIIIREKAPARTGVCPVGTPRSRSSQEHTEERTDGLPRINIIPHSHTYETRKTFQDDRLERRDG